MEEKVLRVAYADDHVAVRKGIIGIIEKSGTSKVVIEANDGVELIAALKNASELLDVCILDISMPVMNGFDTLVEVKKKWPQMKVLVFTMFQTEHHIIQMIKHGANGYLLKDCPQQEINDAIWSIHETGIYHSALVPSRFSKAIKQNLISLPNLTEMELIVLKYACTDLTYSEISVKMKTTKRSVEGYRDSLFRKLSVNSRVSLALYAVQSGLVPLEAEHNVA